MRALSVIAVIWAHAKLPGLPGGFTGVDVFFVISGFLITRLLLAEMTRTGRIDLLAFWARRARRLLPNAFATLIATLLLAMFIFPAYNPADLVQEVLFAALQFANFHFADEAVDYFRAEGPASPVLHFWSLNVEEQFYMVWPLLLIGIGLIFRRHILLAAAVSLLLIWAVSFTASVIITHSEQPVAYFNSGLRAWQLASGALLAAGWREIERLPRPLRVAAAWGGLAAIVTGMAIIDEKTLYPGAWALLPTLGTAGLILGFGAARADSPLRQGLAAPAMQWIGARSYSWYLWHWPLLALVSVAYPDAMALQLAAVAASLVVGCAAYSWIETPIRTGQMLAAPTLPTLAGATAGLGAVALMAAAYGPFLSVVDAKMAQRHAQIEHASEDRASVNKKCLLPRKETAQPDCLYGDAAAPRRAVLFGDSHAAHWFSPINIAAKQTGWRLHYWTKSSCPSADTDTLLRGLPYEACYEWRRGVMERLTGPDRPDLVILSNFVGGDGVQERKEQWRAGLRRTIERLLDAGVEVLVIRDVPRAAKNYRHCLVTQDVCERPRAAAFAAADLDAQVAREFGGRVILADFSDEFCSPAACPAMKDGMIVYRDEHHLASSFAATFAPQMVKYLERVAERRGPANILSISQAEAR